MPNEEGWQEGLLGRHAREKRVRLGQLLNLGRHVLHAALFATPLGRGLPMRLHSRPIAWETRRSTVATVPKGEAWNERPLLGRWKWAGHAGLG